MRYEKLPRHIAIIPDGNRRWARSRGLPTVAGHKRGVDILGDILEELLEDGVCYISVWGSSVSNIEKRSNVELSGLFSVFENAAVRMLRRLNNPEKQPFQVRLSGLWEEKLPASTVRRFQELIEGSKHNEGRIINLLMAYDGRQEMLRACDALVRRGETPVTPEAIKRELYTADMPEVDLLIRSGCKGDPHWSDGFMMWDCANAQLYFTEMTWPEFGLVGVRDALESFQGRERRLGA